MYSDPDAFLDSAEELAKDGVDVLGVIDVNSGMLYSVASVEREVDENGAATLWIKVEEM